MTKENKNLEVVELDEELDYCESTECVEIEEAGKGKKIISKVLKIFVPVSVIFGIGYKCGKNAGLSAAQVTEVVEDVVDVIE